MEEDPIIIKEIGTIPITKKEENTALTEEEAEVTTKVTSRTKTITRLRQNRKK